jgi:hypothetical protein
MNEQELPTVDVSKFHTYEKPGAPWKVLDQQSDQEDAAMQKALGIPALIKRQGEQAKKALAKQKKEKGIGTVVVLGQLTPVGTTPDGDVVAVALQLALLDISKYSDGRWVGFVCHPEDYEELRQKIEAQVTAYRNFIENQIRGLEKKN